MRSLLTSTVKNINLELSLIPSFLKVTFRILSHHSRRGQPLRQPRFLSCLMILYPYIKLFLYEGHSLILFISEYFEFIHLFLFGVQWEFQQIMLFLLVIKTPHFWIFLGIIIVLENVDWCIMPWNPNKVLERQVFTKDGILQLNIPSLFRRGRLRKIPNQKLAFPCKLLF